MRSNTASNDPCFADVLLLMLNFSHTTRKLSFVILPPLRKASTCMPSFSYSQRMKSFDGSSVGTQKNIPDMFFFVKMALTMARTKS